MKTWTVKYWDKNLPCLNDFLNQVVVYAHCRKCAEMSFLMCYPEQYYTIKNINQKTN